MTFISYAQNFEDVMLWRALKNIENGFYIDIGANDPEEDSVTKHFYDRGWSGINVEPLQIHYQDLLQERPRDINVKAAIGNVSGEIEVWESDVRGLATASVEVISKYQEQGSLGHKIKVPLITLTELCKKNDVDNIHFLKVDVEGLEKAVIEGMDFTAYRPWIIVIEATFPNSTIENFNEWEPIILDADYQAAYCDGLNRFYIANERIELKQALRYPPNIFDNFKINAHKKSEVRAEEAEAKAREASARVLVAEAKAEQAISNLNEIYASTSWRITAPLRWFGHQIILFKQHGLKIRVKALCRKILQHCILFINNKPRLKRLVTSGARRLGLENILRPIYMSSAHDLSLQNEQKELNHLTPSSKDIYQKLKSALKNKKRQN